MKLQKFDCPYCGGSVDVDMNGRNFVFCSYCGQKLLLDDDKIDIRITKNININKAYHKIFTDDAKVIREKNKDKQHKREWVLIVVLFLVGLMVPLGMLVKFEIEEKIAKSEGKISAGYYDDLVGEDYKTVKAHFEAAGFTNIELIDLDDAGIMFWDEGKVKTISVGGDTDFDSTDWFEPDVKVVISYH